MDYVNNIENITFIPTQTIEMFNYKLLPNNIKEYYSTLKNYNFIRDEKGFYDLKTLLYKNKEKKDNFTYRHDIRDILDIKYNYIITGIKEKETSNGDSDRILNINFKKDNWPEKLLENIDNIINNINRQKQNKINLKFYILMNDKDNIFINNKGEFYKLEEFKKKILNKDYFFEDYIPLNFDISPKTEIVSLFKDLYNLLNNKFIVEESINYDKIMFLYNYDKLEDDVNFNIVANDTTIYNLKGCYFITNKLVNKNQNIYDSKIPMIGTLELLNKDKDLYRFKITSFKDIKTNKKIIKTINIYIKKKWNMISYTYNIKDIEVYNEYEDYLFLKEKGDIIEYDNTSLRSGIITTKKLYRDYEKEIDVFYIPKFYNIEYKTFKKNYGDNFIEGLKVFTDVNKITNYIDMNDLRKKKQNDEELQLSINELIKIIMKNNNKFFIRNVKTTIKNEDIFYKYNIIYKNIENIDNIFKKTDINNIYQIKNINDNYKEYFNPTILQNIKLKNIKYLVFIKLQLFKKNVNKKLDCTYTLKQIKKYFKKVILNGGKIKKTKKNKN